MAGKVMPRELALETASGFTIGEGIRRLGGDPERLEEGGVSPGEVAGFFELHVELKAEFRRCRPARWFLFKIDRFFDCGDRPRDDILTTLDEMAFQHHTYDTVLSRFDLAGDVSVIDQQAAVGIPQLSQSDIHAE